MSSHKSGEQTAAENPYAAPHAPTASRLTYKPAVRLLVVWLVVSALLQVVFATITIHNIEFSAGGIEAPFLHLIATSALIIISTLILTRQFPFSTAILTSQLTNLIQWVMFYLTVEILCWSGFSNRNLSREDRWIFLGICLAGAVLVAVLCFVFSQRQSESEASA